MTASHESRFTIRRVKFCEQHYLKHVETGGRSERYEQLLPGQLGELCDVTWPGNCKELAIYVESVKAVNAGIVNEDQKRLELAKGNG